MCFQFPRHHNTIQRIRKLVDYSDEYHNMETQVDIVIRAGPIWGTMRVFAGTWLWWYLSLDQNQQLQHWRHCQTQWDQETTHNQAVIQTKILLTIVHHESRVLTTMISDQLTRIYQEIITMCPHVHILDTTSSYLQAASCQQHTFSEMMERLERYDCSPQFQFPIVLIVPGHL